MSNLVDRLRNTNRRMRLLSGLIAFVAAGAVVALALPTGTARHNNARGSKPVLVDGGTSAYDNGSVQARNGSVQAQRSEASPSALGMTIAGSTVSNSGTADAVSSAPGAQVAPPQPVPPVPGGGLVPSPGAHVIRTASIELEVKRHRGGAAFDRVTVIAGEFGGYVASSTRSTGDSAGGQLEIRVPAARFDEARRALATVGKVRGEQLRGQDVGDQLVDMDARLKSLQSEEATLRSLMAQAKTVGEVLQVQPQLFDVRRQIEQLQAQRTQLDQQASFSTFSVSVTEVGAAAKPDPKSEPVLARSAKTAWHASLSVLGGMVIVAGALIPFALLAMLGWIAVRARRRVGRTAAPAAAPLAP